MSQNETLSQVQSLLQNLTQPQKSAIHLVKLSLDCFNSYDGAGLFTGMARYNVLAARTEIAATQARDLHGFWSTLLRKMNWPMPPKIMDQRIVSALNAENQPQILRALATETVSIITIARMLHDDDKETKRQFKKEQALANHDFDDDILEGF